MLHVISLGAGVQSSTLALMFAAGELSPMPACAIFADTGAEPRRVYEYLDWLQTRLPYPVHRVMHKSGLLANIRESVQGGRFAGAPFYTESATPGGGALRRQCTREFKVQPITQKLRELLGLKKGQHAGKATRVVQYIGISFDEAMRMKPSREAWIEHRWPLVDRRMTRQHCLEWLRARGSRMPGKSSCTFCPYHDDSSWRAMKLYDPAAWHQAVEVDLIIRAGVRGTRQKLYLHRSLKPLAEVDFRNAADFGQVDAFNNECEGLCNV